jgi:hypothetical protein
MQFRTPVSTYFLWAVVSSMFRDFQGYLDLSHAYIPWPSGQSRTWEDLSVSSAVSIWIDEGQTHPCYGQGLAQVL